MVSRKRLGFLALVAAWALAPAAAPAITILDSTWKANGGTEDDKPIGFAAHQALAQQQPFKGAVEIFTGGEDAASGGSGTWIGSDDEGRNYILTAAHVVWAGKKGPMPPDEVKVLVGGTTVYWAQAIHVSPWWLRGFKNDMAIIVTGSEADPNLQEEGTEPLAFTDQSEQAPMLYCAPGVAYSKPVGTVVGFGRAGTGSVGSDDPDYVPDGPIAAHNVIDGLTVDPEEEAKNNPDPTRDDETDGEDAEAATDDSADPRFFGMLVTDFDSEDGSTNTLGEKFAGNEFYSDAKPVDKLEGDAQQGDSGGPLWVKDEDGWLIAGVVSIGEASAGEPDGAYGSVSYFAPVSESFEWIANVFPGVKMSDGDGHDCSDAVIGRDLTPDWERTEPEFARYHIDGQSNNDVDDESSSDDQDEVDDDSDDEAE